MTQFTTSIGRHLALLVLGLVAACSAQGTSGSGGSTATGGAPAMGGTGGTGGPVCATGQVQCTSGCADLSSDEGNCGSCGTVCSLGTSCTIGVCACDTGLTECSGSCVDTQSSGGNCGSCGTVCASGDVCSGGLCQSTCGAGLQQCGTDCVDFATNIAHCGGCNQPCAAGQACTGGTCQCTGTQEQLCGGRCVGVEADPANCGSCGVNCGANACNAGVCATGSGGSGGTAGASAGGTGGTGNACPGRAADAYQGVPNAIPGTVEAENYDPAGYSDTTTGNEGGVYRTDDVDIKTMGAGYAVGWMNAGEWLEYTVNVATAGDYTLTLRAGAVDAGRTLQVSECGTALTAPVAIPQIAAWGDMATSAGVTVHLEAGLQVIRFTVGANDYLDFDSFTLTLGASGTGGSGGTGGTTGGTGGTTGGTGGATGGTGGKPPGTAQAGDITIDPNTTHQTMDGFGIADVWQGQNTSSAAQRTLFWDPTQGIGMTILRIGIDENGRIMGDAGFVEGPVVSGFGGKVWAAPWSPPGSAKDNNDVNNGGHLLTSAYESWATTLAAFPAYYKQNTGADLWGISAQNEPDFVASYRSCIYSADQMNNFIKVLGPKLKALNPPVHLLAAEPDVWSHVWNNGDKYGTAIEGDATVSALVDVIATHDYGSNVQSTTRPSPPANLSHRLWQTEATYTAGAGIGPALDFDRCIYAAVTSGGANGWVYWWTPEFLNGGSTTNPPKRVYAMGNFSKFVRPGYVRVNITGAPSSVQIVPFFNQADGKLAIVALNSGTSAQQVSFFVSGSAWPGTVTPYVTSASSNLAAGSPVTANAGRFSGTLEGQSITTFVGVQ